jgi:hypothetical protein
MAAKNTLFADCATMLLRRALNEGFALTIVVTREGARADGVDLDGCAIKLTSRSSQLALPLEPEPNPAPPCEHPASVEATAPAPVLDPLAPGHRVMRVGDAVFEASSDGSVTWVSERIDEERGLVHMSNMPLYAKTVARADIRLDAADLWRLASPWDRPEVGDRIELDGHPVEVLSTSRDGFVWREVDPDAVALEEGEAKWADVMPFAPGVWVTRDPEADEMPAPTPPPKAKRARKPRAPKAAPSTEPAAPVPHRLQAVTEADELAHHGEHSLIGLRGGEWLTLATRASAETLPEWHLRCTTASKAVRVRVYDRGAHCTWDSADGNGEGHIQGNP